MDEEDIRNIISRAGIVIGTADTAQQVIDKMDEPLRPLAHAIVKSGQAGKEFTDSLGSIGKLLEKPGMTVDMLRPITILSFDNIIERLMGIRASIIAPVKNDDPVAD